MDNRFDLTTLELLMQRLETEDNPELKEMVNELIMSSKKAGTLGLELKEIASLCTLGFIVSQDPQLQSFVAYLISRLQEDSGVFN